MIVLSTIAFLYTFWLAYLITMGLYRAHLAGRLTGTVKWLAYPIVFVAICMDILTQYTIATAVFFDAPAKGEHLVTARLQRYMKQPTDWRYPVAKVICDSLLDPFDPTGDHC